MQLQSLLRSLRAPVVSLWLASRHRRARLGAGPGEHDAVPKPAAVATVPGMPPVVDPANLYSETASGKLSPAVAGDLPRVYVPNLQIERRLRDRSGDVQGRRQVQGRPQSAARGPVVRPAHAVGRQQRGEHDARQPDARGPEDRQARQGDPRRRSLQHVFLARRQIGDRRRRSDEAARLPRSADDAAPVLDRRAALRGHQSCRFLDRRPLRDLHLRVLRHRRQDRSRQPQGAGLHAGDPAGPADQGRQGARRQGRSRSARRGKACRRTFAPRPTASSSSSPT